MDSPSTALVWFRRDLRLKDNPALHNALKNYQRVILLYIHAPHEEKPWEPGAASRWWLHHSLMSLHKSIEGKGGRLIIEQGDSLSVLQRYVEGCGVNAVFWNRLYEPALVERDRQIKQHLQKQGMLCHSFNGSVLFEPFSVTNKTGMPYRVFSAYWRHCEPLLQYLAQPLDEPAALSSGPLPVSATTVEGLNLIPGIQWYADFAKHWQPGEAGAAQQLQRFLDEALMVYKDGRDLPSRNNTSRLSAALHFGEISPRQIIWQTNVQVPFAEGLEKHRRHFFSEIGWREFSVYLLFHFPKSAGHSLDERFDQAGWTDDEQAVQWLQRWQQGKTGIPVVDAGMRELWQTGWMHNRVRMIVASVLTKNLGLHWLEGARWFWDTLVDADLAANTMGWQWTAGCGVDAAPYFRVFSPPRQTERFDSEGLYIRRWVPELAEATDRQIREGLRADETLNGYPPPMIDFSTTRKQALARWDQIRELPRQMSM